MNHKFRTGQWVTIIKIEMVPKQDMHYWKQFVGKAYKINGRIRREYSLQIRPFNGDPHSYSLWEYDELRLATPEEIKTAKERIVAEEL